MKKKMTQSLVNKNLHFRLICLLFVNKVISFIFQDIYALTFIFVIINIISATQDIVLGKKKTIFQNSNIFFWF